MSELVIDIGIIALVLTVDALASGLVERPHYENNADQILAAYGTCRIK